ncbi:MAG: ComEC/Rec2 family competence protein [Anaerolineae bacterium]|nr:ComEC/Rec2 family competence protein [Anaerolineae bacterium]
MTLIYLTLAWVTGLIVAANAAVPLPAAVLWGVVAAGTLGAILRRADGTHRLLLLCLVLGALGMLRLNTASAPPPDDALVHYNDAGWYTVEGLITAEPDVRDRQINLVVAADRIRAHNDAPWQPVQGLLLVQAPRSGHYTYGDRVQVSGALETPPEFDTFSWRDYLARQGVLTLVRYAQVDVLSSGHGSPFMQVLLAVKTRAMAVITGALPEPHASLLTGILLGVESGIAADVRDDFNATGASHVIAISGFNMTLIAGIVSGGLQALWPARRRLTATVGIATIAVYTLFVGAAPAVARAAIMSSLLVIAPLFQRKTYVPASLACAALGMSAADPFVLWDVGFQLSFAAVMGMALFVDPIAAGFRRLFARLMPNERAERLVTALDEPLVVTLAAQITTLPLIAYTFGRFSLASFAVNFLILPVQSAILILGGLATLIGLAVPALGLPFFWGAWVFLAWTVGVVRVFADLPGASLEVAINREVVIVFYLGILVWALLKATRPAWLSKVGPFLRRQRTALFVTGAGALTAVVLWIAVLSLPDGLLAVHFLDAGHSNAVLIETPDGIQILIDGGRYPSQLLAALGDHLPFWDRAIELLILTQPKDTQIGAIPAVLERYTVGQVLTNGQRGDFQNYTALVEALATYGIPALAAYAGYTVETSDGVRLEVLYPPAPPDPDGAPNDAGLVLRLSYGDASFLLTPDLSEMAEGRLLASGAWLGAAVLELPSHGSGDVSSAAFLAAVRPQVAVVQAAPGNTYDDPAPEVLARLGGTPLYRTDQQGDITITTDGATLWVSTD